MALTSGLWDLDPLGPRTPSWKQWANEIDPLGQRPNWSSWSQPLYTYGNQPRSSVEFDPLPRGEMYDPLSQSFGYLNTTDASIDTWMKQNHPELFTFDQTKAGGGNPGSIASPGGAWATVDRWDDMILNAIRTAAQETGVYVPANLVKSIMRVESGGENGTGAGVDSQQGAIGLMQVMPDWGPQLGLDLRDPQQNILAGVKVLIDGYNSGDPANGDKSWEWASRRYLGLGAPDANGTDNNTYWDRVTGYWDDLNATAGYTNEKGGNAPTNTTNFNAIWGAIDAPISQEYGPTEFSQQSGSYYDYGAAYTLNGQPMGHPGVDVGIVRGTGLRSPINGVVKISGNTPYYTYYGNGGPGIGELLIEAPNGDQLILGHMSDIHVRVGDTISAGQFVGYSGGDNGDHVHVEYRKYLGPEGTGTSSGYLLVDPRQALQGNFSGSLGGIPKGGPQVAAPISNWNWFLRAAMTGQPISTFSSQPGFHESFRGILGKIGAPGGNDSFGQFGESDLPTSWLLGKTTPIKPPTTPTTGTGSSNAKP